MNEHTPKNLLRFWEDEDVKELLLAVREDILDEWESGKTKEKREECHAELRCLRRLIGKFRSKCEHADVTDTRKLRT